jgi:hypothetical protein
MGDGPEGSGVLGGIKGVLRTYRMVDYVYPIHAIPIGYLGTMRRIHTECVLCARLPMTQTGKQSTRGATSMH